MLLVIGQYLLSFSQTSLSRVNSVVLFSRESQTVLEKSYANDSTTTNSVSTSHKRDERIVHFRMMNITEAIRHAVSFASVDAAQTNLSPMSLK